MFMLCICIFNKKGISYTEMPPLNANRNYLRISNVLIIARYRIKSDFFK